MKLSECISYINQALNYPSLVFSDVSVYFNMAMAELNTTLHISLPSVTTMQKNFEQFVSNKTSNKVILSQEDLDSTIPSGEAPDSVGFPSYFYSTTLKQYAIKNNTPDPTYEYYDTLYGVCAVNGVLKYVEAFLLTEDNPMWVNAELDVNDLDLAEYLPDDWVLLWLIPYVCFKYTCRDGGTASTFADELTQGFQQLQESYSVPSKVFLTTYAEKVAYRDDVLAHINDLNVNVPTRAIYEHMKHSRSTSAIYGNMFDRGGFGI